jgi:excisionase family DNA binding protein
MRITLNTNRPLKVTDAAAALGLSVHTVRWWIAKGKLTHVRLGGAIRILPSDIHEFIRGSTVPARDRKATARTDLG